LTTVTRDEWLNLAIDEIESQYGVQVRPKNKTLHKFGSTSNADDGVRTTVSNFLGAVVNETYSTANEAYAVVSDAAGDTGQLAIEGHYFDSSNNLVFFTETITLTGLTPVPLSRDVCRVNRLAITGGTYAAPATALVGTVSAYATSGVTVTAGVPQTATAVKCLIVAGFQQSEKCASSISNTDFFVVTSVYAEGTRATGSAATIEIDVEYRSIGGVFRPMGLKGTIRTAANSVYSDKLKPYRIIQNNSDFRMIAISDAANVAVGGYISGTLCEVIGD